MAKTKMTLDALLKNAAKDSGIKENAFIDYTHIDNLEKNVDVISTGIKELDMNLDVPGFPLMGIVVEIFGPEASGKSYIGLTTSAENQKRGGNTVWIDFEGSFNPDRAKDIGIDVHSDSFQVASYFDCGEQAFEFVSHLVDAAPRIDEDKESEDAKDLKDYVSLIVIDSIAAASPNIEQTRKLDDTQQSGSHAAMMSKAIRKITHKMRNRKICVILINQIRAQNIQNPYAGQHEGSTGGWALKFFPSVRLAVKSYLNRKPSDEMAKQGWSSFGIFNEDEELVGAYSHCKIVKTRFRGPMGEMLFPIYFTDSPPDEFTNFYNLISNAQLINSKRGIYKYPNVERKDQALVSSKNIFRFFDGLIEKDLLGQLIEQLGISDVEDYENKVIAAYEKRMETENLDESNSYDVFDEEDISEE